MIRCSRRAFALIATIAAVVAFMPRTAHAQAPFNCHGCDFITVTNSAQCSIHLCFAGALVSCRDFPPGSAARVPCNGTTAIFVRICTGALQQLGPGCTTVQIGGGCCVVICLELDAAGCPIIRITRSPIACDCP